MKCIESVRRNRALSAAHSRGSDLPPSVSFNTLVRHSDKYLCLTRAHVIRGDE